MPKNAVFSMIGFRSPERKYAGCPIRWQKPGKVSPPECQNSSCAVRPSLPLRLRMVGHYGVACGASTAGDGKCRKKRRTSGAEYGHLQREIELRLDAPPGGPGARRARLAGLRKRFRERLGETG